MKELDTFYPPGRAVQTILYTRKISPTIQNTVWIVALTPTFLPSLDRNPRSIAWREGVFPIFSQDGIEVSRVWH